MTAINSYFGDAYGEVLVECTDGGGNLIKFYSGSMSPSRKAKVFFDPETTVDGGPPAEGSPPSWYVFWRQQDSRGVRAVPGLEDFGYRHEDWYGESYVAKSSFFLFSNTVLLNVGKPAGSTHYPSGLLVNGIQLGGATGIDCCAEVVAHELKHNVYSLAIQSGAADTDPPVPPAFPDPGDLLPDSDEPALGCVVGNKDTFNVAGAKRVPEYGGYGDGEYAVMLHARGRKGNASADWSKGGKQW